MLGRSKSQIKASQQHVIAESRARPSKVRNLISCFSFTCFNPSPALVNVDMRCTKEAISTRLLELRKSYGEGLSKVYKKIPTTSLIDDASCICGRDKDRDAILELVLSGEASGSGGFCVTGIVGMGGVGKTTLAQLVYNDKRVVDFFDLRVWVFVSDSFDVVMVTRTILEAVTGQKYESNNLNLLQVTLKKELFAKRFFIILDDVWNENYGQWDALRRPFADGATGSKIVVTTRNRCVLSIMDAVSPYPLNRLSNNDCLSVFAYHALRKTNFEAHSNLHGIGPKIADRCEGLPLAAKTFAGLLRTVGNYDEGEYRSNFEKWDLPEKMSSILPALYLSYDNLPYHLKQCFASCYSLPRNHELCEDEIVQSWIDKGVLLPSIGMKDMKKIGHEYFEELLSRSFFQQSSRNESRFVMHNFHIDLAEFVAGKT